MKLRIMSDIHLEFGPLDLYPIGEDVLLLAGDMGVGTQGPEWAERYYRRTGVAVVMIAGNHEFYHEPDIDETLYELRQRGASVIFLEKGTHYTPHARFVGTTLWTDYMLNARDEPDRIGAMFRAQSSMNDHQLIRTENRTFLPNDALKRHEASRKWLAETLAKRVDVPTVVMTHHLPSARSVAGRYADSAYNAAYASNLDALVEHSGAALWIHGHTHVSQDYTIGTTRVICNPRGYVGREVNPQFNPNFIVEV